MGLPGGNALAYVVDVVGKNEPDGAVRHIGKFDTLEEATDAARRAVDEVLQGAYEAGLTPKELFARYVQTGVIPCIFLDHDANTFNQRTFNHYQYALQGCAKLCGSIPRG
jgi:hypothetical protein